MTDPAGRPPQRLSTDPDHPFPGAAAPGQARAQGRQGLIQRPGSTGRTDREPPAPAFLERIRTGPSRIVRPGGRERVTAPMAIAAVCPFLAGPDGDYRASAPSRDHRCGAVDPPTRLPVEKQAQLCLRTRHFECPAFVAATAPGVALTTSRPVPRSAPLILERAEPTLTIAGLHVPARAVQYGLAGVLVIALAIVLLGGGDGRVPASVAGVTSPPGSNAAAAASGSPRRTARPTARSAAPAASAAAGATAAPSAPADPGAAASADPTSTPGADATDAPEPTATPKPKPTPAGPAPTATSAAGETASPSGAASERTYKVKRGDTLSAIAIRFGTTVKVLQELNDIADPRYIQVGQVLKLP